MFSTTYLPTFCLLILVQMTFYFPEDNFQVRATVALSCLLILSSMQLFLQFTHFFFFLNFAPFFFSFVWKYLTKSTNNHNYNFHWGLDDVCSSANFSTDYPSNYYWICERKRKEVYLQSEGNFLEKRSRTRFQFLINPTLMFREWQQLPQMHQTFWVKIKAAK